MATSQSLKAMIVAVEPSGDLIGASVIKELVHQSTVPISVFGVGGDAMTATGLQSLFSISPFTVMGVTDALKALPLALRRAKELAQEAERRKADIAIFIDGWEFSRLCAISFKKYAPEVKLIKLAAPQVWASRPQRVDFVKDHFEGVLTLLPFEPEWFQRAGIKASFVGNPNFQSAWENRGDAGRFRKNHQLQAQKSIVVLLGSRKSEVKAHAEIFGKVVQGLKKKIGDLDIFSPVVSSQRQLVEEEVGKWMHPPTLIDADEKYDALAAADAALAVSGTISTEIAINKTPMVIAYRTDPLTAYFARRQVTSRFVSIVNIAAEQLIIPEFLQEDCTPEKLELALFDLIMTNAGVEQIEKFEPILENLGVKENNAAAKAARLILDWSV